MLKVAEWRRARQLTQEQLALAADITVDTLRRIEGGGVPRPDTARKLAQALGKSVSQLSERPGSDRELTSQFVDSASIFEIVTALSHSKRELSSCYEWAWQGAIEVTCTIMTHPRITLAPSPGPSRNSTGPYPILVKALREIVVQENPSETAMHEASEATKQWSSTAEGIALLRSRVAEARDVRTNSGKWLDIAIGTAWAENAQRMTALFNLGFIPQVSAILNIDEKALRQIWLLSQDRIVVEEFARERPDSDDFATMRDAYYASVLLRGIYHEQMARESTWGVIHHPLRRRILAETVPDSSIAFPSKVAHYLASIALAGAISEPTHTRRLIAWVNNVTTVRRAILTGSISLGESGDNEEAIKMAVTIAKTLELRTHPHLLDSVLDAMLSLGMGVLSNFMIAPWVGFAMGIGQYTMALKTEINAAERLNRLVYLRQGRLTELATYEAGRIDRAWRN